VQKAVCARTARATVGAAEAANDRFRGFRRSHETLHGVTSCYTARSALASQSPPRRVYSGKGAT